MTTYKGQVFYLVRNDKYKTLRFLPCFSALCDYIDKYREYDFRILQCVVLETDDGLEIREQYKLRAEHGHVITGGEL